ncbi:MAG TPA: hypothetical protein VHB20_19560 [Verrucomicrobiae bacterium]|jgi:ABC-type sulfate transport system permease component|nr:hypothetical protein [Verrucomicrobiae bacterium]
MKSRVAVKWLWGGLVFVALLAVVSIVGLLWALPASQRRDGMLGVAAAVLFLSAGFIAIYRVARAMEREEAKQEAEEAARAAEDK